MRLKTPLYGIQGVASASNATLNIPCNARIHQLTLFTSANSGAITDATLIIDRIKLIVNGVLIRNVTPAQAIAVSKLNGVTPPAGVVPLWFSEPSRRTIIGEETFALDLKSQSSCTLEVTFKTVTAPVLNVMSVHDDGSTYVTNADGSKTLIRTVMKQLPQTYVAGASGVQDITNMSIAKPIHRIHLIPSAGNITRVEVLADNVRVHDMSKSENDAILAFSGIDGTAFGAGAYSICFDSDQQITSPLIPTESLVVRPVLDTAAVTLTMLIEARTVGFA